MGEFYGANLVQAAVPLIPVIIVATGTSEIVNLILKMVV
jgi:hypothetical protein